MSQTADQPGAAGAVAAEQPLFQIEKLYVKDLSLEVPNAPQIFMHAEPPQLEVQISQQAAQFSDGLYDVVVTVTVTARAGEKTVFLAEVAQAGIFSVRGIAAQELEPLLGIGCPTILYPYAREAISDLVTRAGFPAVVLQPVSFEQMYVERHRQAADAPRIQVPQ
ncbi:MAG TPA: protein-export chaperone SecB [Burkholderiales bacterium]|jgi:preprotein translocase subunit SecB|nr:protein-export chaperone SecB [Burkholderiales bacterium]